MDALSYINYLTSIMQPENTQSGSVYALTMDDDNLNQVGGSYFKITEVGGAESTSSQGNYQIDIGYPGTNYVSNFSINDNEQWTILYDTATANKNDEYQYTIDNSGNVVKQQSPALMRSQNTYKVEEFDKQWWKK